VDAASFIKAGSGGAAAFPGVFHKDCFFVAEVRLDRGAFPHWSAIRTEGYAFAILESEAGRAAAPFGVFYELPGFGAKVRLVFRAGVHRGGINAAERAVQPCGGLDLFRAFGMKIKIAEASVEQKKDSEDVCICLHGWDIGAINIKNNGFAGRKAAFSS
jgi:hypothetical protein